MQLRKIPLKNRAAFLRALGRNQFRHASVELVNTTSMDILYESIGELIEVEMTHGKPDPSLYDLRLFWESLESQRPSFLFPILQALAQRGPLKFLHIVYAADINCNLLREFLDFLTQQNLVEERTVYNNRTVYAITDRGRRILEYFRQMKTLLPIDSWVSNVVGPYSPPAIP